MNDENYNYTRDTQFSALAPIRRSFDVTPGAGALQDVTRSVMVSEDSTITGTLVGDDAEHTTFTLKAGTMYPFSFSHISAVSNSATVKAYY